jgi:hypothetical protein
VTAITEAPESLDWVRFSDEEDERCQTMRTDCPNEAVALVFWDTACRCVPNPQRQCVKHRDETIRHDQEAPGRFYCPRCGATGRLLRIEPLR